MTPPPTTSTVGKRLSHQARCELSRALRRRARAVSPDAAFKVLDVILETTLMGWGKVGDRISMGNLAIQAAGENQEPMSERSVRRCLIGLAEIKVIGYRPGSGRGWRNFTQVWVLPTEDELAGLTQQDRLLAVEGLNVFEPSWPLTP